MSTRLKRVFGAVREKLAGRRNGAKADDHGFRAYFLNSRAGRKKSCDERITIAFSRIRRKRGEQRPAVARRDQRAGRRTRVERAKGRPRPAWGGAPQGRARARRGGRRPSRRRPRRRVAVLSTRP